MSCHSFRIGAATSAADLPDHLIQSLGRWSRHTSDTSVPHQTCF